MVGSELVFACWIYRTPLVPEMGHHYGANPPEGLEVHKRGSPEGR